MTPLFPTILALSLGIAALGGCIGGQTDDTPQTDTGQTSENAQWYVTCGDPVCQEYGGPFSGVPLCTDEGIVVGAGCTDGEIDDRCDPVDGCNALVVCATEDPTMQPGGCPISRAEHKEKIHYLTEAERDLASQELLQLKLARWQYKAPLSDGATHLGFMIDDMPGSAAVRPDGGHVDLYGYTSLAVAAIQQQQLQLDQLKAELEVLKNTCGQAAE